MPEEQENKIKECFEYKSKRSVEGLISESLDIDIKQVNKDLEYRSRIIGNRIFSLTN